MPVVRVYPASVKSGSGYGQFTDAELAKVLGDTTTYATYYGTANSNSGIYGSFYFDTTVIPVGAVINSVTGGVLARASAAGYRSFFAVEGIYSSLSNTYSTNEQALTTVNTSPTVVVNGVKNWPVDSIRNTNIEWSFGFLSKAAGYVYTYWTKAWLDIDYTDGAPAQPGGSLLFMGENF